ncbi:MAG TPA: hypothetical protein VHV30_08265, partial [Polyangiaceae bacterium]|nr:hypothetical protein [Polyangiaceae bacterium]
MPLHATRGRIFTGLLAAGLSGLGAAAALPACSSTATVVPDASTPPACPDSFATTNGAACAMSGQTCNVEAPCGAFATPASCICTGGVFACSAVVHTLDAGTTLVPADPDASTLCLPATPDGACPA